MSKRVWHKGPPPHVGWWNASVCRAHDSWRWWNGTYWSISAFIEDTPSNAANCASHKYTPQNSIEWTNFWPENARVPRIKP